MAFPIFSGSTFRGLAPALLAVIAWFAVLLQLWLSIQLALANGKSVLGGAIIFFGYFTVITNIFVALMATAGALRLRTRIRLWLYEAPAVGCATTAILIVGIVYHMLLREIWSPQGAQWLADILLHYVVPVGALLHWLIYPHDQRIPTWAPLAWSLYPLTYLAYVLVRGELLASYPYPFIDITALGYRRSMVNALGMLAAFVGLGFIVLGTSRQLYKKYASS